jgi:hypothetical protein
MYLYTDRLAAAPVGVHRRDFVRHMDRLEREVHEQALRRRRRRRRRAPHGFLAVWLWTSWRRRRCSGFSARRSAR